MARIALQYGTPLVYHRRKQLIESTPLTFIQPATDCDYKRQQPVVHMQLRRNEFKSACGGGRGGGANFDSIRRK